MEMAGSSALNRLLEHSGRHPRGQGFHRGGAESRAASHGEHHRAGVAPRILAAGLHVMPLIATMVLLAATVANTGDGPIHGSRYSNSQGRASADRELAAEARNIDRASVGETRVARYLGAEFGIGEEAITAEKRDLGASWGNLTIAHTLAASDKQGMTVAQVLQLHDRGMEWGEVAAGLGLELHDAIEAVNAESRVARGRATAGGKVARIGAVAF